jgi:hypothetical protein
LVKLEQIRRLLKRGTESREKEPKDDCRCEQEEQEKDDGEDHGGYDGDDCDG